ncbi:MAG: hypothetical protein NT178_00500 [Proteobacteria bacterium]|nr:hypothetical protein [Pseudomonadota bacterium]
MRYFIFILFFLIIFPANALCQKKVAIVQHQVDEKFLSEVEADKYKSFLSEMRTSDRKREFADYKEDRDTKYRKLSESIAFEEREASIANQRAWEGRYKETYDTRMSYINKGYSAQTDRESVRAFRAADQLRPPAKSSMDVYKR